MPMCRWGRFWGRVGQEAEPPFDNTPATAPPHHPHHSFTTSPHHLRFPYKALHMLDKLAFWKIIKANSISELVDIYQLRFQNSYF